MKAFKTIGLTILGLTLIAGYTVKQYENNQANRIINSKLDQTIKQDSITNARITKIYRDFHNKYAPVLREDYCKEVRKHIDKTHSPNHFTCKWVKG